MRNAVILVGNGLNQCSSGVSWTALMDELRQMVHPPVKEAPSYAKPYSMLFDEVTLMENVQEVEVRKKMRTMLLRQRPNDLHRKLLALPAADVLTTNYDYTLEFASDGSAPIKSGSRETRYSLFRRHEVFCNGPKRIWHIHGELNVPRSIQIGFDDYSGALEGLRAYITKGRQAPSDKNMRRRMWSWKGGDAKAALTSWADAFFTRDVYILGLSLEFVEISLWWLLVYRAKHYLGSDLEYPAKNTLTFYRREPRQQGGEDDAVRQTIRKAQSDLLDAAGVKVVSLTAKDWESFYDKVIDGIGQRLKT